MLAVQFQLEQSQWWPPDKILEHQFAQLRHVVAHAVANVPYYRDHLIRCGVASVAGLTPQTYLRWPVLTRRGLQEHYGGLTANGYPPAHGGTLELFTTGSTAMPTRVLYTEVAQFFSHAMGLRDHLWHGRDFTGKLAAIRFLARPGSQPGWSPATNAVFHTGPAAIIEVTTDVDAQLAWLIGEQPDYLLTSPSNLAALLAHSAESGKRPSTLKGVMTYAEALPDGLANRVRKQWGATMTDTYSCTEFGPLALQCPTGDRYHVHSENAYVEIVREDGAPCEPGETGRVVVTGLHNFGMPLLRYELGDMARVGAECACGRGLPVIERIAGRVRNMARGPDGKLFQPGFDDAIHAAAVPVMQFQIVQVAPAVLDMQYVMDRELEADERARLAQALSTGMGYPVTVRFLRAASIPRAPGGKYEGFVSRIADVH